VICVNEGGPKEFVENGRNGVVIDADEESLAYAMIKITEKKIYSKLVKGAIKSEKYDEKRFIKGFDALVERLVSKTKSNK
jgi:Glycosyl transferases group 1.